MLRGAANFRIGRMWRPLRMCEELTVIVLTDQKPKRTKLAAALLQVLPGEAKSIQARPIHADLAAVALIDAPTSASVGGMRVSWWYNEVAEGRAPAPAIRQPRCTRWRVVDVARFWAERAAMGASDPARTTAQAKHASDAARRPRSRR